MTERTAKALRKMLMHTERVLQYATKDWVKDALRVDAIVFNLSQIGELVRLVDEETQAMHPQIPWTAMRGFRNRIVHDYDSIQFSILQATVHQDLPILASALKVLL